MKRDEVSAHGKEIQRALQESVADAIEEHRRSGKPIVVARDGKPVRVDPNTVRTVRENSPDYGAENRSR